MVLVDTSRGRLVEVTAVDCGKAKRRDLSSLSSAPNSYSMDLQSNTSWKRTACCPVVPGIGNNIFKVDLHLQVIILPVQFPQVALFIGIRQFSWYILPHRWCCTCWSSGRANLLKPPISLQSGARSRSIHSFGAWTSRVAGPIILWCTFYQRMHNLPIYLLAVFYCSGLGITKASLRAECLLNIKDYFFTSTFSHGLSSGHQY